MSMKYANDLVKITYKLATCLPSHKENATRLKIPRFVYDENLRMHFRHYEEVFAYDPDKLCKTGDTVLIQSLPKRMTRLISYKVIEVIYPCGDFTDPITGKKVAASLYRDDVKFKSELYGSNESGYDYDKAPPRGRLEDIKDFTHKQSYTKYHEDPDDPQPYGI